MVSHELATIRTDAPITFDPANARIETLDTPRAQQALEALHFPSLIKRLRGERNPSEMKSEDTIVNKKAKTDTEQQQLF